MEPLHWSLLARVFGGIFFGRIGDREGRKPVIMLCIFALAVLMLLSAFLPSVHSHSLYGDSILSAPILFVLTRVIIGFFVGGIWPTAAVLAMENLYLVKEGKIKHITDVTKYDAALVGEPCSSGDEKERIEIEEEQKRFKEVTQKLTRESSILQVGFHAGHLTAGLLVFVLLICAYSFGLNSLHLLFNDILIWRIISLVGGIFGLFWFFFCKKYMSESQEWQAQEKKFKGVFQKSGIKVLLTCEGKRYQSVLFNFWLILTGLIYMYYSTIVVVTRYASSERNCLAHNNRECHLFYTISTSIGCYVGCTHLAWIRLRLCLEARSQI